ncbi:unnamed protein product [Allacma fusca]|uniref:Tyr recombinase domain-containing protein n=1 Tax=Allacma fusca TaxID=39272 RepID=A0A8J2KD89_9HEXA|nr:unnamed protein product [Allacma fusca]
MVSRFVKALIKTSRPGVPSPCFQFSFYPEDKLCVGRTLQEYLKVTMGYRSSDQLFLCTQRPFTPASNQTLSRWLKLGLKLCGIDVTKFKAHSYRHASTSKVFSKGINVDIILSCAGWRANSGVFAKFYNRPIETVSEYQDVVLSR